MTTLQEKIDAHSYFRSLDQMHMIPTGIVNQAIQELREELTEMLDGNYRLKELKDKEDYYQGKIDMLEQIIALIGEKK